MTIKPEDLQDPLWAPEDDAQEDALEPPSVYDKGGELKHPGWDDKPSGRVGRRWD